MQVLQNISATLADSRAGRSNVRYNPSQHDIVAARQRVEPYIEEVHKTGTAHATAKEQAVDALGREDLVRISPVLPVSSLDWRDRALRIPSETLWHANPATTKVTLPAPAKWKLTDVTSRDPVVFLREQGKHQSVLEYATVFRNVALSATPDISGWVLCDKFVSGLSVPELQRECMTPFSGGKWDDLQACISHAMTCEQRVMGRLGVRNNYAGSANVMRNVPNASVAKTAGMSTQPTPHGSGMHASDTINATMGNKWKRNRGKNKQHVSPAPPAPHFGRMQNNGGCFECG
eukprot:1134036-Pelagomonas_calceolata.AAC.1